MKPNPLKIWLDGAGVTPEAFAPKAGCSESHLRNILNGNKSTGAEVGYRIEDATGGNVTHRALYEWHAEHRANKSEQKDAA